MVLAAGGVAAAWGWSRPTALSYRGGSPAEIESLWRFERKWYEQVDSSVSLFSPGLVGAGLRAEDRNNPKAVLGLINWDLNLLFLPER